MSTIRIENLTFAYPGSAENVFENLNLQLDSDWKLGLVGRNGRGKTTLLNLLLGRYEYRGRIASTVAFESFPCRVEEPALPAGDVLARICPNAREWQWNRELSLLEVAPEVLDAPFEALSEGERTKVLLAALFLNEGRFPLIDEPTNHLDARAREKVSAYLRRQRGFLLVSHDRRFLDGCVDHVLSLNRSDVELRGGSFSAWFSDFEQRQEAERERDERLRRDIGRMKQAARRTAGWADKVEASKIGAGDKGYVGHKSAKMMQRAKAIEVRQQRAIDQRSELLRNAETAGELKLSPLAHRADVLVAYEGVVVRYGARSVNAPIAFEVRRGERIALDGGNGSGKSSLLKLLLGEPIAHEGSVRIASGLAVSYVPQGTGHMQGSLAGFAREHCLDESLFKAILRKMGFERGQFERDLRKFSEGQKKKVLLARSLCERAHLYVWDEPLNYIDLYSRIQIERLILEFSPTMLFVEHDAAFREKAATRIVRL